MIENMASNAPLLPDLRDFYEKNPRNSHLFPGFDERDCEER